MKYVYFIAISTAIGLAVVAMTKQSKNSVYVDYLEESGVKCIQKQTDGPSHMKKTFYVCDNNETFKWWEPTSSQKEIISKFN